MGKQSKRFAVNEFGAGICLAGLQDSFPVHPVIGATVNAVFPNDDQISA
jgi:hypothetical protein